MRPAHGYEHVRAGLDQHAFIHGHEDLAVRIGLVGQNARRQRRHAIEPVRQEPKRTLARLGDDARHAGFLGEDLERQENLKIHERRRHVRPSVRRSASAWLRFGGCRLAAAAAFAFASSIAPIM